MPIERQVSRTVRLPSFSGLQQIRVHPQEDGDLRVEYIYVLKDAATGEILGTGLRSEFPEIPRERRQALKNLLVNDGLRMVYEKEGITVDSSVQATLTADAALPAERAQPAGAPR
jgi:hypothetical protein